LLLGDKHERDEIGWGLWNTWGEETCGWVSVGKSGLNTPLTSPRQRWEDNIKVYFKEIGWEGVG